MEIPAAELQKFGIETVTAYISVSTNDGGYVVYATQSYDGGIDWGKSIKLSYNVE